MADVATEPSIVLRANCLQKPRPHNVPPAMDALVGVLDLSHSGTRTALPSAYECVCFRGLPRMGFQGVMYPPNRKERLCIPLCDIPSGCCSPTGPWTVTRSYLRMLCQVVHPPPPPRPPLHRRGRGR